MKETKTESNLKINDLTKKLLNNRGFFSDEDIEKFLNPSYERDVADPFLIYGMEKAVKRIIKAIKAGEKIVIYSDYDCDGVPGGVLLRDFFDAIGYENICVYIPHRHNEGYGLNIEAIDKLKKDGVSLMITVDLAITNLEEIKYAEDLGINVIVTDHHLPIYEDGKEILPKAFVVINSKQDKCDYHDDMLCGCAVAWKLVCALLSKLRDEKINKEIDEKVKSLPDGYEKWLLDLVAISTVADMVPLQKENRALAYFGIKVLQKCKRQGLKNIFLKSGVSISNINEDDISFTIAPRINAAGRMGHPIQAHNMLYEKDPILSQFYVNEIDDLNNLRKQSVKDVVDDISFDHDVYKNDVVVVGNVDWSPGILGLIAQKIIDETGKPTFVWGRGEDEKILKGSCRSRGDVHVVSLMQKVGHDIFTHWGGHEQAGGFSLDIKNKDKLSDALNEVFKGMEVREIENEKTKIDSDISFDDINHTTYEAINALSPFGVANPKPIFSFPKTKPLSVRRFGKQSEHIEVIYNSNSGQVKAIKFFTDEKLEEKLKKEHKLIAHFEKSYFRGKGELRLRIVDVA